MKNLHKKAFSLIEISVVILIIGMLIAGISQGIDLYQDSRLATARSLTLNSRVNRIEDLTMWFEATSEKSFEKPNPNDGDRIALWKNINFKLSNRIDVLQTDLDSTKKPLYIRNAINNIPALRFDNAQFLTASNVKISEIVSSDQATVFMVQNNFSGDQSTSTFGWNSGSYRFQSHAQELNKVVMDFGDFGVNGSNGSRVKTSILTNFLNQNKIITLVKNGSNNKIKINLETLLNSSTLGQSMDTSLSGNFLIGKYVDGYNFLGYIGELIIFKKALTDAEINDVEKYLSKKWAIKIN
jgi:prepilin-type N-terminal cleavage/methylation domain-containing protein